MISDISEGRIIHTLETQGNSISDYFLVVDAIGLTNQFISLPTYELISVLPGTSLCSVPACVRPQRGDTQERAGHDRVSFLEG